jgi:zinc protease
MKKISTYLLLIVCSFGFSFLAQAQSASTYTEAQAKLITELNINGLKVILKRRPTSPTVAAGLFLRGGVRNYTAENAGIESFMLNSSSDFDYSIISLVSTSQNFSRSWEILTDLFLNPSFAPEDVELVRQRLFTTLKDDADTPDGLLELLKEEKIFAGHPYSKNPRGTIENIKKLKVADLQKYHQSMLQTSRWLLVVVGDIEVSDLQKKITDSFGKLSTGNYTETALPAFNFTQPSLSITPKNLETNYVQGVFPTPSLKDPDYHAMKVATTILQSRIYSEVRVRRNLSYAPDADMDNSASNTGKIYVTSNYANEAVEVMLKEIEILKNFPVEEEEISGIVGFFLTTYYIKQETNAAQAGELALYELNGGDWRNSLKFLDGVKKVNSQDIQRVAKKYMKNLQFIYLGNPDGVDRKIFIR